MPRLLLADDTETYLVLEQRVLGARYEYLLARNGQEAVRVAREALPDLVLMDMSMPLMTGEEAMRILKLDRATAHIPIVVVTAEASYEARVRELNPAAFLKKPFSDAELSSTVERILSTANASTAAVLIKVAGRSVAFPLDAVREIVAMPRLSPLPGAPRHVQGALNLRGEAIPVYDLVSRLGFKAMAASESQLLVVLADDALPLAVTVDDADEVVEIERSAFFPTPAELAPTFGSLAHALLGVWRRGVDVVPVLSPLKLVPEGVRTEAGALAARLRASAEGSAR